MRDPVAILKEAISFAAIQERSNKMSSVPKLLQSALAYAHNKDVRDAIELVLERLDKDLEDVGFEASDRTESAVEELETAMNEFDEEVASKRAALKEAEVAAKEEEEGEE